MLIKKNVMISVAIFCGGCSSDSLIIDSPNMFQYGCMRNNSGEMVSTIKKENDSAKYSCYVIGNLEKYELNYYQANSLEEKANWRDRWISTVLAEADSNWKHYKNQLQGGQATTKTITETLVTTFGAASAAVGSSAIATKNTLAVLSASLNGFNTSFDKNILQNNAISLILNTIESRRTVIDGQIAQGMKQSVTNYSLALASRDVMRYIEAGSLASGLSALQSTVGQQQAQSDAFRNSVSPQSPSVDVKELSNTPPGTTTSGVSAQPIKPRETPAASPSEPAASPSQPAASS
jgi:hypothetical protein